jgi:hypothetical protein
MSFCEHCQGQRFDRAQVLRALREVQRKLGHSAGSQAMTRTLAIAIDTIRRMEIPHLEVEEEDVTGQSVH